MNVRSGEFHEFERAGWEKAACQYDQRFSELTLQSMEPLLDVVGTSPGSRLLDVACGPGHVAAAAARRGCSVVGVDFSASMVAAACQAHPDLDFREGDAEKLDFPDDSFDAVVMNFGMLHLELPERAATEAFRVLCPGGRYAFTVWDVPENALGFSVILQSIQSGGNIDAPLPAGPPFFRFSDPEEGRRLLSDAGFLNVQSIQVPQVWRLQSGDDLFTTFETAAVRTAALLHAQTPSALKKIRQEVTSRVEAFRRGDTIEVPMPAVLTHGLRPRS